MVSDPDGQIGFFSWFNKNKETDDSILRVNWDGIERDVQPHGASLTDYPIEASYILLWMYVRPTSLVGMWDKIV